MIKLLAIFVVVTAAILAVRGLKRSGLMLALMWATYVIEQVAQQYLPFMLVRPWIANFAITAFTTLALIRALNQEQLRGFTLTKSHLQIISLFLIVYASYFWSIVETRTFSELKRNTPYVLAFIFIAPICAYSKEQVKNAVNCTIYFGGLVLLALALGNFGGRGAVIEVGFGKTIEANPLAAATFGGYVAICSIYTVYASRDKKWVVIGLNLAIALLAIYSIIRSGSRGQLLSLLVACFIWLPITAKVVAKRSSVIAIAAAFVLALGAVWFISSQGYGTRWKADFVTRASTGRLDQTGYVIGKMLDGGPVAWLVGLGSSASYKLIGGYPHNIPGEILGEEGFLGFGLYLAFVIGVTLTGLKLMKDERNDPVSRLMLGILLTLFTFEFGVSLKQGSFINSPGMPCTGLCIAVFAHMSRRQPNFYPGYSTR